MTTVTLTSTESRHQKAFAILAYRSQWLNVRTRDGRTVVGVPSQTKTGLIHLVAADGSECDCFDARRHLCKHQVAVKLDRIARGVQQPASETVDGLADMVEQRAADRTGLDRIFGKPRKEQKPVLEMVREDDGSISWQRAADRRLAERYDDIFKRFEGD